MKNSDYKPDLKDFHSGLEPGVSRLNCESHRGRTRSRRNKPRVRPEITTTKKKGKRTKASEK